ncbi:MAG: VanZ family protein [Burkholderiaceae bacterium]
MRRAVLWVTWGIAIGILLAAILLPNTGLAQLRSDLRWFNQAISWTEKQWPQLDMIHIIMFSSLTLLVRLTWPKTPLRWLLVAMVATAATTELVQIWVPGRRASWSDLGQDLIGLGAAALVLMIFRHPHRFGRSARLETPSDHP